MRKLKLDSLQHYPALYIALSAGVDSVVLLHLIHEWAAQRKAPPVYAIHVHHGLQKAADDFACHCENYCATLNIPLHVLKIQVTPQKGESLEALARAARYEALLSVVPKGAAIVLGHHANDQAENFLLRALRGSGLRGLAGMQTHSSLSERHLVRPLLRYARQEIESYAAEHDLKWCDDPSNQSNVFARNFLRNTIFPQLTAYFPKANMTLARTAMHLQEVHVFVDEQVQEKFKLLEEAGAFDIQLWKTWHPLLQKLVLQKWIEGQTGLLPSSLCLKTVMQEVMLAGLDRHPEYHWQGWWFSRGKGCLILLRRGLHVMPST